MPPPLAIVATYNDVDIFPQILLGLLQDGIDVAVIDNWSVDGTYEAVREVASDLRGAVTVERWPESGPDEYFEWRKILERKEEIAARSPGRWIIHQDSDEIHASPWPGVSFHEGLRRVAAEAFSAVDLGCVDFRPIDDPFRSGLVSDDHFRFFERDLLHPPHIRAWLQPAARVDLAASGGHQAVFSGRRVYPQKFLIKHYSLRNAEQARRKIAERSRRFHPDERAVGWHVQYDDFRQDRSFVWGKEQLLEWGRDAAIVSNDGDSARRRGVRRSWARFARAL